MAEEVINITIDEIVEDVNIVVNETTESVTVTIQEPSKTSDLINDGEDGINPFITAQQVPTVNDATSTLKGILKLTNDLGGTADSPTVPALANKVDKVTGKGLSTNDYTTAEQTKLAGIAAGAEVNVNADWNATSGDAQILNKPTIPTVIGDMFKATYDVDNTGVVDNAEAISIIGRNSTGSTLYRGTIVYLSGATGNRPNFAKAQANAESTSAGTFGVIVDDLSNNSDGYCVALGYLDNLDTRSTATNPFTTDTLSAGDTIYLSPTNAGYITNVKPSAPNHLVYLGKVTRTSPTNGTIVYRIQNGYELEELHNVAISSVSDKQLLSYDSATSLWKNKSVTTADISDSTNKRYVTDANLTTIGNQSGTNTGDETTATIKTKLGAATTSVDGYLTSTDWNIFNNKPSDLFTTNRQTASYTLVLADRNKLVEMNVATANNLTIPLNSSVAFPTGTKIDIVQYGAGQTTFVATSGVTIRSANNWLKINAKYGAATLTKIGTDEWYLWGNLNA